MSSKRRRSGNYELKKMVTALDELALFDKFRTEILPSIQKDLMDGLSDDDIIQKYKPMVAARMITNALLETDTAKSTAAGKDVLDRASGKAAEKREVTHRLAKLPDQELDAVLQTKLARLETGGEDE